METRLPRWFRIGAPLALFGLASLLLATHLGEPAQVVFDEAHYVQWSREIARGHLVRDYALKDLGNLPDAPVNFEHPPLAKLLMAASIRLHGAGQTDLTWEQYHQGCEKAPTPCPAGRSWAGCDRPNRACGREAHAWRLPSALAGASGVAAAYLLALRLFNSVGAGAMAALLLGLDGLWYLHSRMAMLDIFVGAFTLWAFACALGPRRRHPWLAGLLMGAALGSKDPAFFLLPLFLLVQFVRTRPRSPPLRLAAGLGFGLALPLAAWAATYTPFFLHWTQEAGPGYALSQFVVSTGVMFGVHLTSGFDHPYASPAWAWIPHVRPVFYYWPTYPDYQPPLQYAVGNVAAWWPAAGAALVAPVALLGRWLRTDAALFLRWDALRALPRQPFGLTPGRALGLSLALFWVGFAPWFLLQRKIFNFYFTFNAPYLAILWAGVLHLAWQRGPRGRAAATGSLAAAGAWFALWWPLVSGAEVATAFFDLVWRLVPWMGSEVP